MYIPAACFTILLMYGYYLDAKVHIFGDSHAYYCFSNAQEKGEWEERSVFRFKRRGLMRYLRFDIHYLGSVTMHRVGRDGFAILNVGGIVRQGDTLVFVFGEIDVRCHIGKQRDEKGRSLDEIINTLVKNYFRTISANVQLCPDVKVVVMGTVPPRDPAPEFLSLPIYGSLEDRVQVNNALCDALAAACLEHGYYFLDIRPDLSNSDGSMAFELSDGIVHVGLPHNRIIKEELLTLIEE